jgi:hypothetical protein
MATDACQRAIAAGLVLLGACQSEVQLPHAPPAPVVAIGALTTTVHIQPPELIGPDRILSYTVVDSYGQHVFQASDLESYSFGCSRPWIRVEQVRWDRQVADFRAIFGFLEDPLKHPEIRHGQDNPLQAQPEPQRQAGGEGKGGSSVSGRTDGSGEGTA